MNKKGFTLIEMLVVLGIIAVLMGSLLAGFNHIMKSAQRAKAQETVSNAATALSVILQENKSWPNSIINEAAKNPSQMTVDVARYLAKKRYMAISYKKVGNDKYQLIGTDRCGIVSPWAAAVLKRTGGASASENTGLEEKVPTGGTVKDHLLHFAVDLDGDGITEANVNGTTVKIRASAATWCAGADGVLAPYNQMGRSDDVYSWQKAQEQK